MPKPKPKKTSPAKRAKAKPSRGRPAAGPPKPSAPRADRSASTDAYAKIKEEAATRRRDISRSGRDIGELPPVANPARKKAALASLRLYCETYFPRRFRLAWSKTHLLLIAELQKVIVHGGLCAAAVERGFGKTTLLEVAVLWAGSKGLHPFVQLIGSSKGHALEMLDAIKGELEDNELLADDFPEICYPIGRLDGIAGRAPGQLYQGQRTKIGITKEELTLPTIPGSPASGAIIRVTGITGRIRGRKKRLVRPSLVLLDDPQTDASAGSLTQTDKREDIITGAVLGLAGPDKEISTLMTGTVIAVGDLMHRFLDPARHAGWIKHRFKRLITFPKNLALWEQYWSIRTDELRNGGDGLQATTFYRDRRDLMDEGAEASWPERYRPGELSAIQSSMNRYFTSPSAFAAEDQNQPEEKKLGGEGQLDAEALAKQTNGLARGVAPLKATHLTAFVDVQQRLLFWMICAWADDFTGVVLDYGTYPDQRRTFFTAADAQHTLARIAPGAGDEAAILKGLGQLTEILLAREFRREDQMGLPLERILIDSGFAGGTVFSFCRQLPHTQQAIIMPSKGIGVGAGQAPMSDYRKREGERLGTHWLVKPAIGSKRASRNVLIDTNHWKTFIGSRLRQVAGDRGALTLFGRPGDPAHRLLIDHLVSEYWDRRHSETRGRWVCEWQLRPGRRENHWFDCLVGCAAGASMQGCALIQGEATPALGQKKTRVRWSERLRQKKAGRAPL